MCIIKYVIVYIQIHNLKSSHNRIVDKILAVVIVERYFYN